MSLHGLASRSSPPSLQSAIRYASSRSHCAGPSCRTECMCCYTSAQQRRQLDSGRVAHGRMVSCAIVQPCLAYRFCKRVSLTLEVQTRSVLLRRSVVNRGLAASDPLTNSSGDPLLGFILLSYDSGSVLNPVLLEGKSIGSLHARL